MILLINQIIQTMLMITLSSMIPLWYYLITRKTLKGFFNYIGIYLPTKTDNKYIISMISIAYIITLIFNIIVIITGNSNRSIGIMEDVNYLILVVGLIFYGLQTGVAEEILFRGFIAKGLIKNHGFKYGNVIQAFIFAVPHFVINGTASNIDILVRIINAFILGYVFGFVMHKKSNDSAYFNQYDI